MTRVAPKVAVLGQVLLTLVLGAALSVPAAGQVRADPQSTTVADTLEAVAQTAGRLAAGEPGVGAYFVSSFLGGLTAGFFLPIGVGTSDGSYLGLGAAGAAAIVVSTWSAAGRDVAVPPAIQHDLRDRGPDYQQAFRAAYADHLSQRRVRASLLGGGIGAGIGLAGLIWLGSQFDEF